LQESPELLEVKMGTENDTPSDENDNSRRTDDNDEVRNNKILFTVTSFLCNYRHGSLQQDTNTSGAHTKRQSERITQAKNNSKKDESANGESLKFLIHFR
jgi:hypothetical protein